MPPLLPQRKRSARSKNGQQCTARRLLRAGALVLFKSPLKGGRTFNDGAPVHELHVRPPPANKKRRCRRQRLFSLSKNLVAFRRRSGERKSDHFLRRHVRRRKYFSACKRARWPPKVDGACAAAGRKPLCQKGILFDSLKKDAAGGSAFFMHAFLSPSRARDTRPRGCRRGYGRRG